MFTNLVICINLSPPPTTFPQGTDSVVRQVGHHIEYEPEWEMAISMQMKLGPCLTLLLDWCASDVSPLSTLKKQLFIVCTVNSA